MQRICFAVVALLVLLAPSLTRAQSPTDSSVTPLVGASGARPGTTIDIALKVSLPEGLHSQSNKPRDAGLIPTTVTFTAADGVTPTELVFPPAKDFKLETGDVLLVFEREFVIGARASIAASATPGTSITLSARLRYQPCNNVMCFRPVVVPVSWTIPVVAPGTAVTKLEREIFSKIAFGKGEPATIEPPTLGGAASTTPDGEASTPPDLSAFTVAGTAGGYMNVDSFLKFISNAEAGIVEKGMFADQGPIAILLLVFVGGLALNLTPCVLPMIPINLAIIGTGSMGSSGSKGSSGSVRGFWLGSAYGAAMALVYGVLGLIVILTAGTFGTINASPWFNAGIAVLFVVLGLAMFDIGAIDFSRFGNRIRFSDGGRGTFGVAFGMGAVAALLAGACVAPVVIQVIVFASDLYAKGSTIALALPFVLGLGMALPWPIAGAGLSKLPKPGAWMNNVKYAFGVFILAMAAYYGYLAYDIVSSRWVNQADVEASTAEKLKEGWYASIDDGLKAAKASGQPVLIDLWATWCKNCLTMDKTTLADARVKAALSGYVKIKFQAEDPDAPGVNDVMKTLNAVGLPAYAIVKPK
jgi:thiol:disulfide interchange protein DsbD